MRKFKRKISDTATRKNVKKGIATSVLCSAMLFGFAGLMAGCDQAGAKVEDGSKWLTGTAVPIQSQGNNGDMYLDTDDYILYQKIDGKWEPIMNQFGKAGLHGGDGASGQRGSQWLTGTDDPSTLHDTYVGDMYLDVNTNILYQKTAENSWNIVIDNFGVGVRSTNTTYKYNTEGKLVAVLTITYTNGQIEVIETIVPARPINVSIYDQANALDPTGNVYGYYISETEAFNNDFGINVIASYTDGSSEKICVTRDMLVNSITGNAIENLSAGVHQLTVRYKGVKTAETVYVGVYTDEVIGYSCIQEPTNESPIDSTINFALNAYFGDVAPENAYTLNNIDIDVSNLRDENGAVLDNDFFSIPEGQQNINKTVRFDYNSQTYTATVEIVKDLTDVNYIKLFDDSNNEVVSLNIYDDEFANEADFVSFIKQDYSVKKYTYDKNAMPDAVDWEDCTVTGFIPNSVSNQTITISYNGKTVSLTLVVLKNMSSANTIATLSYENQMQQLILGPTLTAYDNGYVEVATGVPASRFEFIDEENPANVKTYLGGSVMYFTIDSENGTINALQPEGEATELDCDFDFIGLLNNWYAQGQTGNSGELQQQVQPEVGSNGEGRNQMKLYVDLYDDVELNGGVRYVTFSIADEKLVTLQLDNNNRCNFLGYWFDINEDGCFYNEEKSMSNTPTTSVYFESSIAEKVSTAMESLKFGYNLPNGNSTNEYELNIDDYNDYMRTVNSELDPISLYVEIGSVYGIDLYNTTLSVGEEEYTKNDTISIAMGNNNFIVDNAWRMVDNRLFIAAPILAYDGAVANEIKIGNENIQLVNYSNAQKLYDFNLDFLNADSENVFSQVGVAQQYNFTMKTANEAFGVYFNGTNADSCVLLKKTYEKGSVKTVSYEFAQVENIERNPVGIYPMTYRADGKILLEDIEMRKGQKITYSIYFEGKIVEFSVNIDIPVIEVSNEEELKTALSLANENDRIVLTDNITLINTVIINKKVTLDMAGYTINNTTDIWHDDPNDPKWSLISVREGGDLTIVGDGMFDSKANDCYAVDVLGGKCTIEDGTYIGNISAVYVFMGELDIQGGTFSIIQKSPDERYTINCYDSNYENGSAIVKISGGKFKAFNPANNLSESANTNYVVEGFKVTDNTAVDGYFVVSQMTEAE